MSARHCKMLLRRAGPSCLRSGQNPKETMALIGRLT